jgi:hypothetical protein
VPGFVDKPGTTLILPAARERGTLRPLAASNSAVSRSRTIHSSSRFWLVGARSGSVVALLGKHQLVDATILRGQIWSPTQQGCRVPESPGSVNIRKLHLTYRFGRYAPPVGNLLPVPA